MAGWNRNPFRGWLHQRPRCLRTVAPVAALAGGDACVHGSRLRHRFRRPSRNFRMKAVMAPLFAFVAGLVFGVGLIVAGMVNPAKILGFLDLAGNWDPSLALVMAGAIAVGLIAFALAR